MGIPDFIEVGVCVNTLSASNELDNLYLSAWYNLCGLPVAFVDDMAVHFDRHPVAAHAQVLQQSLHRASVGHLPGFSVDRYRYDSFLPVHLVGFDTLFTRSL